MKILFLSFHFPPEAPLAATRAPKLAKFLIERGHDVMVLCAHDPQPLVTHPLEIDERRVIRTGWRDLRELPTTLRRGEGDKAPCPTPSATGPLPAAASAPAPGPVRRLRARLGRVYDAAICRPDRRMGWASHAHDAARALGCSWRPDLVYATCPPHSTAVIAERIAQAFDVPLIAEFRDRWALDAYSDHPGWRREMDRRQEAEILARAAGIVTVSPLWARSYAERYGDSKVVTAMNGFDPDEYPLEHDVEPACGRERIELLYAGALYPGRRDPSPVFEAIARLGEDARRVQVTMLGKDLEAAHGMAQAAGVAECLRVLPPETHAQVIERQYRADALLMLQWDDPRDAGTVPGKLFECIGARRPVIATGHESGVVADIIRERGLGTLSNDPAVLNTALTDLLVQKRAAGEILPLPARIREGFARGEQFERLLPFLEQVAERRAILEVAQ